jgi:hypothetical protein
MNHSKSLELVDLLGEHGSLCLHRLAKIACISEHKARDRLKYAYCSMRCVDYKYSGCEYVASKHRMYFLVKIA